MPLRINQDGSLPTWGDTEGRRHLASDVEAILTADGGGGPHTHAEADVTNLTANLAAKAASGHNHDAAYSGTAHAHAAYAASGHNHDASYAPTHSHPYAATSHAHVDGDLPAGLARDAEVAAAYSAIGHSHAYAATSHSHPESDVTNLVSDLAGKAASGHNHDAAYATAGHSHGAQGGEAFPVGSLFLSVVSTNPATLLGYGTWSQVAQGLFLAGQTGGQTGGQQIGSATHSHSFTQPTAAGEAAHTHTYSQVINHTHVMTASNTAATSGANATRGSGSQATVTAPNPSGGVAQGTTAAGSSHTHTMSGGAVADGANTPPGFVAYIWQRTA